MLIIHAAHLDGSLALWGEDSDPPPQPDRQPSDHHPRSASANRMAEVLGFGPDDQAAAEAMAIAWLPTQGRNPVPSETMANPAHRSRAKPRIKPWRVPVLKLTTPSTLQILHRFKHNHVPRTGVILSANVAYWQQVVLFAAALAARQQFLPSVAQRGEQAEAVWTPLFIGDDAHRLAELAKAMPGSARALTPLNASREPDTPPQAALKEFITGLMNHIVRQDPDKSAVIPPRTPFDSAHDAWIHALTKPDRTVHASPARLQHLRRQVGEWQRPIAVAANSPYRICLRLEEPTDSDPDTHDPPAAIRQDDWYLRYFLQPHDDHSLLLPLDAAQEQPNHALQPDFNLNEFLLTTLSQAGSVCPSIRESLQTRKPTGTHLGPEQAHQFLTQQAAALQQAGFGVMLPTWWTRRGTKAKPTIRASVKTPAMQGGANMTMASLVDLDVQIALGDQLVEAEELFRLADLKVPLVRFRGQWVEIDVGQIQAAADFWRNRKQLTLREAMQIGLRADQKAEDDNFTLVAEGWLTELLQSLQQKSQIRILETPQEFSGELRPYQTLGYSWLEFLRRWGLGACLADDMGLGKTIQTLAALLRDRQQGNDRPNLLVCPTSVINNWQREAGKFTPDLPVLVHHGPNRDQNEKFAQQAGNHQLVITSYGTMTRDQELLAAVDWRSVILDEAQNIKNPVTRQAQAARSLPADYRIALTGTPVENHVGDLWSIMQFLNPGLLGSQAEFKRRYFNPIQAGGDPDAAIRLQKATGPFILRRLKTDQSIIDDLPDKHESKQYCNLTREQVTLYEAVLRDAETRFETADGMNRRGSILDTLVKLKQVCNPPRQLLGDNSPIEGRSGKLARLQEILDEIIPADDRVLIFSQFAEMGAILQQHVQETYGLETPLFHGGVSRKNRDLMVDRFQNDPKGPQVFVLSLKAGGSGLNLPRANHVIHYDRWWNPAVENQATDRAFRIGQTKDVHVHKMICAGTLEDRIDLMIETKQQTAERVVGASSERWLTELSNAELRDVLALSATPEN